MRTAWAFHDERSLTGNGIGEEIQRDALADDTSAPCAYEVVGLIAPESGEFRQGHDRGFPRSERQNDSLFHEMFPVSAPGRKVVVTEWPGVRPEFRMS